MTKNTATKVVIAAAVFRSNAPNARAVMPATVTYNAAPTTERSAPGSDSDAARRWPAEQCLADEERRETGDQHGQEHHAGEHRQLPPQHRQPAGHHRQGGADHPGAVLTGDQQHPQDTDGQLGEERAGSARWKPRIDRAPDRRADWR